MLPRLRRPEEDKYLVLPVRPGGGAYWSARRCRERSTRPGLSQRPRRDCSARARSPSAHTSISRLGSSWEKRPSQEGAMAESTDGNSIVVGVDGSTRSSDRGSTTPYAPSWRRAPSCSPWDARPTGGTSCPRSAWSAVSVCGTRRSRWSQCPPPTDPCHHSGPSRRALRPGTVPYGGRWRRGCPGGSGDRARLHARDSRAAGGQTEW